MTKKTIKKILGIVLAFNIFPLLLGFFTLIHPSNYSFLGAYGIGWIVDGVIIVFGTFILGILWLLFGDD